MVLDMAIRRPGLLLLSVLGLVPALACGDAGDRGSANQDDRDSGTDGPPGSGSDSSAAVPDAASDRTVPHEDSGSIDARGDGEDGPSDDAPGADASQDGAPSTDGPSTSDGASTSDGPPPLDSGPDARPDGGSTGNDSFLYCRVGCTVDPCQTSCMRDPGREETLDGFLLQYRGRVRISRTVGDSTEVRCGAIDEQQDCAGCWGVQSMDFDFGRIWFSVENLATAAGAVHRAHIRFSWNGLDSSGNPPPPGSYFTDILTELRVQVLDPATSAVLGTATQSINVLPLNPAHVADTCSVAYAYDIDVKIPSGPGTADLVEVSYAGNYE
jgi:hypothetical protein